MSQRLSNLILKLTQKEPEERHKSFQFDFGLVKSHDWLKNFAWDSLIAKSLPAPIVPKLASLVDTRYFDNYEDVELEYDKETYFDLFENP